jgi:protein SCO1/2
MLCGLQLQALLNGGEAARAEGRVSGLQGLDWTAGQEFEMLTVSFDALETPALALAKKKNYLAALDRPGSEKGWHFLTGLKHNIQALTEAVGFRFKWNAERREYAHPPVAIVCTPDGTVSQYLTGLIYDSEDLKAALVTAGRGEKGSLIHQFLLTCFLYNTDDGSYAADAMKIMRTSGILIVLIVGGFLIMSWRRSARRKSKAVRGAER